MSRRRILLVSLVSSIAILVLLVAYSIPGVLKGDTSPNPPIVLHPSQLLPPLKGEVARCRQEISATINGVAGNDVSFLNTLEVIDSTPETYTVKFELEVKSKSGIFEHMEAKFSGEAVLDSVLHTVIRYSQPSPVFFPVSLDFAGVPLLSNGSEIRSDGEKWTEKEVVFTPTASTFKGDDFIKLTAKSELSNGAFILSSSKWPYVKWLSITTQESYQPIPHSPAVYIPSFPESGRVPPPLDIRFRTFDSNRTIVVEILD